MKVFKTLLAAILLSAGAFAAHRACAACSPAPLSDAKVRSNYAWAQKVSRMSQAELDRMAKASRGEARSGAEIRTRMKRFVAKPLSFHLAEMRKYRAACARGDGQWQRPSPAQPECSGNYHCLSNSHCVGGKCILKGRIEGNCKYSSCSPGYHCNNEGVCE